MYRTKFSVGAPPMLGLSGHSAWLMKPLSSSLRSTAPATPGCAYSCTCVSMVKLLIPAKLSRRGFRCSSSASSMAQVDGVAEGVKSEKVRW